MHPASIRKGTAVKVYSARGVRYGECIYYDIHGIIVEFYSGESMYFQHRFMAAGSCYNSGGYSVYPERG